MLNFDFDDIILAIKGKKKIFPRQIYSLWKHFPGKDLKKSDSVQAHINFQELTQCDLIKISPHSKYALVDFGVEFSPSDYNIETGSYTTRKFPIVNTTDWEKIDEFDPQTGELGKQLEIVKEIASTYHQIPTMMTIFLPTMIARKLVQNDNLLAHFNEDKQLVSDRLQVITRVITEFSKICIELGSKGLFLASQETEKTDRWDYTQWRNYAYPYDKQVLEKLKTKTEFQVLHLHGEKIFFTEVLKKLKVDAINFHSFTDFPGYFSQRSIKQLFGGGLLGGLEENYFKFPTTDQKSLDNSLDKLFDEIEPISDRLIIAPNCVLPQSVTNAQLQSIITKIRS